MSNRQAQQQALALRDSFEFEPTSLVTYQSAGKVLAVGDDDGLKLCADLPASLDLVPISSTGKNLQIDGYLGAYVVEVIDQHGNSSSHKGDAIVDLHEAARLTREMLPPGYFHVAAKDWDAAGLTAELEGLQGEFQKPRYFDYDPSICAHGVNGKIACRQCIDACPADAIQSIGEKIEVNPYLCQGGGSCTTVCPSISEPAR
jgi:ferredoxin